MSMQKEIEQHVKELLAVNDDTTLIEQLGMRARGLQIGRADLMGYSAQAMYDGQVMGVMEDVRTLGRQLLNRWSRELYQVMCGSQPGDAEERDSLLKAIGAGDVALAVALTSVLVGTFAVGPAVATAIATLIVKRLLAPTGEEICKLWSQQLDEK